MELGRFEEKVTTKSLNGKVDSVDISSKDLACTFQNLQDFRGKRRRSLHDKKMAKEAELAKDPKQLSKTS